MAGTNYGRIEKYWFYPGFNLMMQMAKSLFHHDLLDCDINSLFSTVMLSLSNYSLSSEYFRDFTSNYNSS